MKYSYIITILLCINASFAQDFNFKSEYKPASDSMIENYFSFFEIITLVTYPFFP